MQRYIVAYDIREPKRLRKVFETMRRYGDHLQYSVFRCDLSRTRYFRLQNDLFRIIDRHHDQVLLIDIGPADGRASHCIEALGQPYTCPERHAIVI